MHKIRILIAEDMAHERIVIEASLRKVLPSSIVPEFSFVDHAEAVLERVKAVRFDLVILDIDFSRSEHSRGMTGLDASLQIKAFNPDIYTVVISSNDEEAVMISAVEDYRVDWYLRRSSISYDELVWLCKQALLSALHASGLLLEKKYKYLTNSAAAKQMLRRVDAVLPYQNALVSGETGTGKELIARRIHANAKAFDPKRPLKVLDCSSISSSLFEAEVFGHKKGSFTGAHCDRDGALKLADGGDLFLDEIHNIPVPMQQKLLRVLNDGVFTPVGSNEEVRSKFRIIAATNIPIEQSISAGRLLPDFVARICKIKIELPPLRERPEDIELLVQDYLASIASVDKEFSQDSFTYMKFLPWPGNIRELRSLIDNAVSSVKVPIISKIDIEKLGKSSSSSEPMQVVSRLQTSAIEGFVDQIIGEPLKLSKLLEEIEKSYLQKATVQSNSLSDLAKACGYSKATLSRRLKDLGLTVTK